MLVLSEAYIWHIIYKLCVSYMFYLCKLHVFVCSLQVVVGKFQVMCNLQVVMFTISNFKVAGGELQVLSLSCKLF